MRRIIIIVLLLATFGLFGCQNAHKVDTSSSNKIVYNVKYISNEAVNQPVEKQTYYIFTSKEKLTYHRYYVYSSSFSEESRVTHYTIEYIYEVMDDGTLAYFYDSIIIHEDDNQTDEAEKKSTSGILLFSENVLTNSNGFLYINENYLEKIPNFGKL